MRLPEAHAEALRLRDRGVGEEAIAELLEIPIEAVAPLVRIAEAKLARLLDSKAPEADSEMGNGDGERRTHEKSR